MRTGVPKYRQVLETIKTDIVSGRYQPGQKLPSEAALIKRFETSRITVGRALRELQQAGLIERRPGSGSYVGTGPVDETGLLFGLLFPNVADTEIFGPVLSLVHANDLDDALAFLDRSAYGNQASLFTSSGSAARRFRYEAPAGNIGINIGVAAPMAYFPFSGWKDSFFGIMHGQGRDAIEFYTEKKVVIERWAKEHSRKF